EHSSCPILDDCLWRADALLIPTLCCVLDQDQEDRYNSLCPDNNYTEWEQMIFYPVTIASQNPKNPHSTKRRNTITKKPVCCPFSLFIECHPILHSSLASHCTRLYPGSNSWIRWKSVVVVVVEQHQHDLPSVTGIAGCSFARASTQAYWLIIFFSCKPNGPRQRLGTKSRRKGFIFECVSKGKEKKEEEEQK
uniref:Uncharacterized protein n=1 Tax=Anopheles albimanus TaxID=7167 RepID=A0A182FWJ7_ANOAL